jgi:hypothetical protein
LVRFWLMMSMRMRCAVSAEPLMLNAFKKLITLTFTCLP